MLESNRTLVFSIASIWIDAIIAGEKKFELRRRPPRLTSLVQALLYETLPGGRLRARCIMGPVLTAPRSELWEKVGSMSGVSRNHFSQYFAKSRFAHAIPILGVQEIHPPLSLLELRQLAQFTPPQSWCWASPELLRFVGLNR